MGLFCLGVEAVCYYQIKNIILEQAVSTLKVIKTLLLLSFISSNELHSYSIKAASNKNQLSTMLRKNVNKYH
jgi:hypothetical protein